MRNAFFLITFLALTACQTTKIKNNTYRISTEAIELGNIGQARSFDLQNDFDVRSVPKIQNKIRVSVEIVPFNKRLNKVYKSKAKYNQAQAKSTYADSLAQKPELVLVNFLDVTGFVNELNASYNNDIFTFLSDTKNSQIISGVAIYLPSDDMAKIRNADNFYVMSTEDRKFSLVTFKQGKKSDAVDMGKGTVISYRTSKFCWAITDRNKPYIADMVDGKGYCKGRTGSSIQEKEKMNNLYRL